MTVVIKQLASKSMRIGEDLFKMLLLVVALFAISFTSNAQVTIVGWDFEDDNNIADSGIPLNSAKVIVTEVGRTISSASYVTTGTGSNGKSIQMIGKDK